MGDAEIARERAKKRGTVLEETYIPITSVGDGKQLKSYQASNYHVDKRGFGVSSINSVYDKSTKTVIYKERNYEDGIVPDKSVKLHSDKVEHSAFVYDEVESKTITKEKNKVPHGLDEETGVYTADNYKNDTRPHTMITYNKKDEYDREDAPYNKADGYHIVKDI